MTLQPSTSIYRNIQKGIEYSPVYLVRFFRNLLLKDGWVLKNRYLHIKEDHIIKREGPAKGGKWIIITS